MKTPLPVDTLVFRRVLLDAPIYFQMSKKKEAEDYLSNLKSGEIAPKKLDEMYALRMVNPNTYAFQQINEPSEAWSGAVRKKTFTGQDNGIWWIIAETGAITTDSADGIYEMNGTDTTALQIQKRFASEFFRLGIFELDVDTLIQLESRPETPDKIPFKGESIDGRTIEGYITSDDNIVTSINYSFNGIRMGLKGRQISLFHDSRGLKSIYVSNINSDSLKPLLYCYYEVLVNKSIQPGEKLSCRVDQFLNDEDHHVLVERNGKMFDVRKGKTEIKPFPKGPGMAKLRIARALFFGLAAAGLIAVIYVTRQKSGRIRSS